MHRVHRAGWLRAAVMGANDGIVSTASLIIGVAAAQTTQAEIMLAGIAGAVAGAMSMAAGEYVSVSSQADIEKADMILEESHINENLEFEKQELAEIYEERGLKPALAAEVAEQLMEHDALGAHARDELGIFENLRARPIQAALSSAGMFTIGAALPLSVAMVTPKEILIPLIAALTLFFLALLGTLAAHAGGASKLAGALRVTFWGALAMLLTAVAGTLFGEMTF